MSSVGPEGTNISDHELALGCARGDRAHALDVLYRPHRPRVYALCLRVTGSAADAEDLSQEVFIQLFRKVGSFRGESAFTTWLHRLTVNHVLMHFRRRGSRIREEEYGASSEKAAAGLWAAAQAPLVDSLVLRLAIGRLPRGRRTVFLLHDVGGYAHEEIARRLGCTSGTSKSQLHKARRTLRKLLLEVSA